MLFASQRIAEFRDRKTKDSRVLINHLKVSCFGMLVSHRASASISFSILALIFNFN